MQFSAIFHRLSEPLGERAASVLTSVLEELQDELRNTVTKSDFSELKAIVRDTGELQRETKAELKALAKSTEQALKELAEAQKSTDEAVKELAEAQKSTDEAVKELAQAQKSTDEAVKELALAQKRTEDAVQSLARQVGGLSEAVGASLEDLARDIVPELLEKYWKMEISSAQPEDLRLNGQHYPFDLVVRGKVEGREVLVLGEVKSNLTASEVRKFVTLVEKAKKFLSDHDVRILFFGYRAERQARELLVEQGASMIFSRGVMIPD